MASYHDAPPPRPDKAKQEKTKQLAAFRRSDANYIAERIGELHSHAILHEGEPCAKLNRARIGGMVEVLSRMACSTCSTWLKKTGEPEMKNFYDICETAVSAAILAGWALAIVSHLWS